MSRVFYIVGSSNTGKDTFLDLIEELHPNTLNRFDSAARVKKAAASLGWNGEKTDKSRQFLASLYEKSMLYNLDPVKSALMATRNTDRTITTIMVRQYWCLCLFQEYIPGKVVLFERDGVHIPEVECDIISQYPMQFEFDYIVRNTGDLEEFKQKALAFYNKYMVR